MEIMFIVVMHLALQALSLASSQANTFVCEENKL